MKGTGLGTQGPWLHAQGSSCYPSTNPVSPRCSKYCRKALSFSRGRGSMWGGKAMPLCPASWVCDVRDHPGTHLASHTLPSLKQMPKCDARCLISGSTSSGIDLCKITCEKAGASPAQHMWAFAGRLQCLAHTYNSTNGNSSQDNSSYDSALNQPS